MFDKHHPHVLEATRGISSRSNLALKGRLNRVAEGGWHHDVSFTARASEASARAGPGAANPARVGVEEKLPPC